MRRKMLLYCNNVMCIIMFRNAKEEENFYYLHNFNPTITHCLFTTNPCMNKSLSFKMMKLMSIPYNNFSIKCLRKDLCYRMTINILKFFIILTGSEGLIALTPNAMASFSLFWNRIVSFSSSPKKGSSHRK